MNSIDALHVLYYNLKSHMTRDNPMFDLEYEQIKRDLKFLEFLKDQFTFMFETLEQECFIQIVGKEDADSNTNYIAYSDLLENNEEIKFLKDYFKEVK